MRRERRSALGQKRGERDGGRDRRWWAAPRSGARRERRSRRRCAPDWPSPVASGCGRAVNGRCARGVVARRVVRTSAGRRRAEGGAGGKAAAAANAARRAVFQLRLADGRSELPLVFSAMQLRPLSFSLLQRSKATTWTVKSCRVLLEGVHRRAGIALAGVEAVGHDDDGLWVVRRTGTFRWRDRWRRRGARSPWASGPPGPSGSWRDRWGRCRESWLCLRRPSPPSRTTSTPRLSLPSKEGRTRPSVFFRMAALDWPSMLIHMLLGKPRTRTASLRLARRTRGEAERRRARPEVRRPKELPRIFRPRRSCAKRLPQVRPGVQITSRLCSLLGGWRTPSFSRCRRGRNWRRTSWSPTRASAL